MSHIRPADRLPPRGADQVEGHVLRVDRDGLLVDWAGRLGTVRHPCSESAAAHSARRQWWMSRRQLSTSEAARKTAR
jgi:hypothetical protein